MNNLIRKAYYFTETDFEAIAAIKLRYGVSSDSDAVRLALRLVATSPPAQIPKTAHKTKRGT